MKNSLTFNILQFKKLTKFICISSIATIIDFSFYIFFYKDFQLSPAIASVVAFIIAAFINFFIHHHVTFPGQKFQMQKLATFYGIGLGGLVITYIGVKSLIIIGINFLFAKAFVTGCVAFYNYLFQTRITFGRS